MTKVVVIDINHVKVYRNFIDVWFTCPWTNHKYFVQWEKLLENVKKLNYKQKSSPKIMEKYLR